MSSAKRFPRLHIFLGAGGVGKTTLSAAFALSLASKGRKVALLSVDPAKRLQTALGLESLPEHGHKINIGGQGELVAALLNPGESLKRWVLETTPSAKARERLLQNPFFIALSDKVASATDTLAAIRMAEWVEHTPDLDDLVIDTAPGIHAIDFLAKPEKLMAFFDSKLIEWLKWFLEEGNSKRGVIHKMMRTGARKILDGLAQVGGHNMLLAFAEFIVLLDEVIVKMVDRLSYSRRWLRSSETDIYVVTALRNDAAAVAWHLARALSNLGLGLRAAVINRALDLKEFRSEVVLRFMDEAKEIAGKTEREAESFRNYIEGMVRIQKRLSEDLRGFAGAVVELPIMANLDGADALRLADLERLGHRLFEGVGEFNLK